jgi:hypothetical protein
MEEDGGHQYPLGLVPPLRNPSVEMFGVVHSQDMQNHPLEYICLSIGLRVEGS